MNPAQASFPDTPMSSARTSEVEDFQAQLMAAPGHPQSIDGVAPPEMVDNKISVYIYIYIYRHPEVTSQGCITGIGNMEAYRPTHEIRQVDGPAADPYGVQETADSIERQLQSLDANIDVLRQMDEAEDRFNFRSL